MNKSTPAGFQPEHGCGDVVGAAGRLGAGAGRFHQRFGQHFGRVGCGSREFQLLEHPAGAVHEQAVKVVEMAKQGTTETKGVDMETYAAVIGLALHEYFGGTHDLESGVLTINQNNHTSWADKSHELRIVPQVHQTTEVK